MAKDFAAMENSNRSANPSIHELSDPSRRIVLRSGFGLGLAALLPGCASTGESGGATGTALGFQSVPPSKADTIVVPTGYRAQVLAPWGEPIGVAGAMPAWKPDASNTAADQAVQMGMHHDGLQFYPLGSGADANRHGLLVMNHEYIDDGLLHTDGLANWSAEKVKKSQAAHGISVIEIKLGADGWQMIRPSRFARRLTAYTPFAVQGPAAGHALMRTAADPEGRRVLGTLNNCASGKTPWGTYLSGEENFVYYFDNGDKSNPHQARWGLPAKATYPWSAHDERFDAKKHPNESNRFGWVVEFDPMDPDSVPVKRTALGRAAHEGAWVATTRDNRAVVYSGEDARFEYIYKFVSRDTIKPGGGAANRELLDHGTLYVAKFEFGNRGRWIPLVHGQSPLTAANGFADQGEVVIKARQASDLLGATKMDRPEWIAIDQTKKTVYCTLTNNSDRGASGKPNVDPANPRASNAMGQIIRWKEDGDFDALAFDWDHLLLAGDPTSSKEENRGNVKGDFFGCPDGLAFDPRGVLWIDTDVSSRELNNGEFARIGNNQVLACDPATGEVRRFLTGPMNCELTGAAFTPDGSTLFVNVQHPGEPAGDRSDPADPGKFSRWPDGGRPRSATVVVRRIDGGVVGT
jgi:secreted PhoX family phosphatase